MEVDFTPEQQELFKYIIMGLLAIPGFFLLKFVLYLITPRFILKKFGKKEKKNKKIKVEKKFYED